MNKQHWVKSEQFISLSALPFSKELQLINYEDFAQELQLKYVSNICALNFEIVLLLDHAYVSDFFSFR